MSFLYDRKESKEDIVIIFKYQPVFYIILLALVLIPPIAEHDPKLQVYLVPPIVLFAVVWILGKLRANREIQKAMRNGKVEVSGSKFSFENPLTFRIRK